MRSKQEVKGKITSLRISDKQRETIKRLAKKHHMTMGNYMISRSVKEGGLTPELLARIQNVLNVAYRAVKKNEPMTAEFLKKEMDALWKLLS